MTAMRETDLYLPVKAFLEGQGYAVKSEVAGADVVACRGDEAPVIVEMKTGFSLALLRQGVARQAVTDWVYLAIPKPAGRAGQQALKANLTLCRRLGLGVLLVRVSDGFVEPRLDPGPYQPRKSKPRQGRLLREFARRSGDPNTGVIIETLTDHGRRFCMAQRFIPEIVDGDRRILLVDGEPVPYVLARIPSPEDARGNLAAGARAEPQPISARERSICMQLGPELRRRGVLFAGIDVIGDWLTEINITSPTCIREIDRAYGTDIAGDLMDRIEVQLNVR